MSVIKSVDLQDSATAYSVSQTDQAGGPSVLPPFSQNLSVDEGLKLSNRYFKQLIEKSFHPITLLSQLQRKHAFPTPQLMAQFAPKPNSYFLKRKVVTPLSQLTATPPFPTPHVLSQFAYKVYEDYKVGETDVQYETRLALPDGWKILTTASNNNKTNGYFGAAYWHPDHQQVVIAHRGTANLGALGADLKGVLLNKCVSQMDSASTFANMVVDELREVSRLKVVSFQLFFTGHSLGGWLSQITTFTTEYLKIEENSFLKIYNEKDCYHPHTVVFDSPGCKDMLLQMRDTFDVRLYGRSIDIEHLDITSYLSAPNRINSCNAHLGTVYRIFPDFSDMGWWKKNTALYNYATHIMQNIVEAFDTETGQLRKDEQGQLKLQVVIDWPISAGLRGGEEYKRFFEWAKHFNNYHPNFQDVSFQHRHYSLIRYQTKLYDERVNSFSVFSEEEQEFLQCYRWLRQWPELYKPKELFCVMEDSQTQEVAEKILQTFEIEKDTVRCTDVNALQALIPYVKRLLQLFPVIKENTKRAMSSDAVRNRVYQFETRRYVERISQTPMEFNCDFSNFREFLENEQQKVLNLQVFKGGEWTGLIKIYQVLQNNNYLIEGQYTVLKLQRLLTVNQFMDISKLMQSTVTPYILLIACEDNQQVDEETKYEIQTLFDTVKQKPNIKIIFTTQSGGNIVAFLHHIGWKIFREGFLRRNEQLTWSDLTTNSQQKLLEKSVIFQGAKIFLNELMSAESPAAKFLPLGALLEEQELKIADPLPISNAYNEGYYIVRILRHQKVIKDDIFNNKHRRDCPDLIACTEQEFKQLCQHSPNSNVHWLERDKSEKLVWQKSQGSLKTLRIYVDTDSSHTYTAVDLDKLLEQAKHQRLMLISDTAGMGKSTILTHLSMQIKQNFPAKWVVRIDLNDHTDALNALKKEQINKEKAIEFVSEKLLKLKPGLELELFKQCCERKQKVRTVIMLDGFDEISPIYTHPVVDFLQALRQTAVEQLWVTTRPHLREELEDKLQQLSYTMEYFSEENQIEFLTNFWRLNDCITEPEDKEEGRDKNKLQVYSEHLIKKLANSINDKGREFTGIPLQTRMLAETFDEEVRTFCQSAESTPELPFKLNLLDLYGRFIERKYEIYQKEKCQVNVNNVVAIEQRERDLKDMRADHQLLALKVLFTEEQVALFQNNSQCTLSGEQLTRIGIVQVTHDGKPQFIHRTFAEFYVADYLVNRLTKGNNTSQQIAFILKNIFLKEQHQVIRVFVDGLLSNYKPSKEVLKQYGNEINNLVKYVKKTFYIAAREGINNIVELLLHSVQAAVHTCTLNDLLPVKHQNEGTVWHIAIRYKNIQVIEKLWEWAEKEHSREEVNKKLLLATDYTRHTVWHVAVKTGEPELIQKVWDLAEEKLTTEEINNKLLLATDLHGRTVWHVAAGCGKLEILQRVWGWAKEKLTIEEISNKLLLATDGEGKTAWHVAAESGKSEILQEIWELAKKKLTTEEINNKMLLVTDNDGRTVWHVAAEKGKPEILEKVWEWAKEKLTKEEINNKLLLATDGKGSTVWHVAAQRGESEIFKKIWVWATEKLTPEEISNKLLLATDGKRRTIWHVAAEWGKSEILEEVWNWATEKLRTEEINNKLLLAIIDEGSTVWHVAAQRGQFKIFQKIWDWAKEKLTKEEINNKLLLATEGKGRTVWHVAAQRGESEKLQKAWEWAKEKLTTEEINNKLLLARDGDGNTVWHMAAEWGRTETLQKEWEWAKEKLTTEAIYSKLLLATNNEGNTVWHLAAKRNPLLSKQLCEWAEEALVTEEMYSKLLLDTDSYGMTVWHVAAKTGNTDLLQKVWDLVKEKITTDEITKKLLLATDCNRKTIWHVAAEKGKSEILQKIWERAKEKLTTEEINNNFLLATDSSGRTVWYVAAKKGKPEILQKVWDLAEEILTTEEINNNLLLATDDEGRTAWHVAAEEGKPEILQKLWDWAKEKLTIEEINKRILLATDRYRRTGWHMVTGLGKSEILQNVWEWAKEKLTTEGINNNLLLATDIYGRSVWHMAAELYPHLWNQLFEWAEEARITDEMYNSLLLATDHYGRTVWHLAANRGESEILQKIWEWAKEKLTTEEICNKLLLTSDRNGRTVWHVAAEKGKPEILQEVWEWGKEKLTKEEINKILLAADFQGRTFWHVAAETGKPDILQKIWEWAKEKFTTEDVSNKLLLASDGKGRTVWHVAADKGKPEILQKVWEWAKEKLTREEISNKLLLATDCKGRTVWHVGTESGKPEILQKVWEWAKEKLTREEISNKLLLATDGERNTVWHVAAKRGGTEILTKIWVCAKEKLTTEEIKNKLLLATDNEGNAVWHVAIKTHNLEVLQKIWVWAKEILTTEEVNKNFLLAPDCYGRTVWHWATERNELEILQEIWDWAKEKLTTKEINNKLLLARNCNGNTVWNVATMSGRTEILEKMWDWAKEKLTTEEINNKFLLAPDPNGRTLWHVATERGESELLQKVWEWAKEKLTREEINNKLLLVTDNKGQTAWHLAAQSGRTEILPKIWEWAKETLTKEEVNNNLLLAADGQGKTAWHIVAELHERETLQKLCDWAERAQISEEIYNKLLLAKDRKGRTVWELTAKRHNLDILEILRSSLKKSKQQWS